ncbi:MAG: hypothetical protein KDN18_07930 [Verrucomicrobiae bacterium]|nr:hypothetical protein [Verrucomicrobiae bacterium]
MSRIQVFQPFLPLLALMLASCGGEDTSGFIERPLSDSEKEFRLAETSMDRFRYSTSPSAAAGENSGGGASGLAYEVPEGWSEKAGSMMRDLNFTFGANGEGECYIARLPGAGGGLSANVNRWRSQMGAQPLSDEEVNALPTRPLFGQPARFITVDGTFSPGMGSNQTFPNYRLIGLILASDAGAVFVKMTGPKELVEQNSAAFDQFVSSLGVNAN